MSMLRSSLFVFAMITTATLVWASESDELREKAQAMQREAAQLAEHGQQKEAANLKREAMTMLKEADRLQQRHPNGQKAEVMELKRFVERLRHEERELAEIDGKEAQREDVRREAERVEMELRRISERPDPRTTADQRPAPGDDIGRRLEHMRIAVDHLNQAGLHDVAEHVAQRAEATERELHVGHENHGGDAMHEIIKQLDELRHEMGRLRDEVNVLREQR